MQAQRAHEPVDAGRPDLAAARPLPLLAEGGAAAAIPSPALRLRDELAARLAALSEAERAAPPAAEPKWPVAARLATIVALSLACWAGVGAVVIAAF